MASKYEQRKSGLIAPVQPPLEHPVRQDIRNALLELHAQLGEYEQTTHGCLGPFTMAGVAASLEECYREPSAYTISDLAQKIAGLIRADSTC